MVRKKAEKDIREYLKDFQFMEEGKSLSLFPSEEGLTQIEFLIIDGKSIPVFINEYWTSRQRKASSIHEISYRACYKPQLPGFFIHLLTEESDIVYDPFCGRGTTVLEAGLLKRQIIANDINPLSKILSYPRFFPPEIDELKKRLDEIPITDGISAEIDLSMFYDPATEAEIVSIRKYLSDRKKQWKEDHLDAWIRMVSTNRLTGHSAGFFSVYTLPPNQAVTQESQRRINEKRDQKPEYRDTKKIIMKKTKSLLRTLDREQRENLTLTGPSAMFLTEDARKTREIPSDSVQMTVTSPPFLDVVQYSKDNWLRCWFNEIDEKEIESNMTMSRTVEEWSSVMQDVFHELYRITRPGGWVCFEAGEVRRGKIKLDEIIAPLGISAGFTCKGILINLQKFTKTSNIWGISNNARGTNTNRIVIFQKN